MKKMTTFFEKDPNNLGRVIDKVREENLWVFAHGIATRKFDGTSCAIIDGELYKRYDAKMNLAGVTNPSVGDEVQKKSRKPFSDKSKISFISEVGVVNDKNPNSESVRLKCGSIMSINQLCKIGEFDGYKKPIPEGAIECQKPDEKSGHHPHWVKCDRGNNCDQYHFEGFDQLESKVDGTYELCGEKVQGNPEKIKGHTLIRHGADVSDFFLSRYPYAYFSSIKRYLTDHDIEGIVFRHKEDGRMCKIRQSDFGLRRL